MSRIENGTQNRESFRKPEAVIAGMVLLYFALIVAKVEFLGENNSASVIENNPVPMINTPEPSVK